MSVSASRADQSLQAHNLIVVMSHFSNVMELRRLARVPSTPTMIEGEIF